MRELKEELGDNFDIIENKNYESVKTDLEQERLRIQNDLDLDLKRMDLDMLRMNP